LCNWKKALENDEEITLTAPHATRKFVSVDHISEKLLEIPVGTQEVDSKSVRLQDLLDAFVEKYRKEGQNVKVNVSGLRGGEQLESGDAEDLCTLEDIKEMI
jgi:FlaA1/EpsC-like NDP-sugar epimerase